MAKIQLQFHVLPDELLDWVEEWKKEFCLHVCVVFFFPDYQIQEIGDVSKLKQRLSTTRPPDEIWLHIKPFNRKHHTKTKLEDANSGAFFISFPDSGKDGLRETLIGAEPKNGEAWPIWKKLEAIVKRRSEKGMWVLNPKMGIKGYRNTARYTSRVADASRNGLVLLPFAGGNVMFVDEPTV